MFFDDKGKNKNKRKTWWPLILSIEMQILSKGNNERDIFYPAGQSIRSWSCCLFQEGIINIQCQALDPWPCRPRTSVPRGTHVPPLHYLHGDILRCFFLFIPFFYLALCVASYIYIYMCVYNKLFILKLTQIIFLKY